MRPEAHERSPSANDLAGDRGLVWACGCATALLFVPLLVPLVTGGVFAAGDLACFHLPLRALYAEALSAGDSVLWSSALFSGFYVHGEGQVGVLHPWHALLYRLLPLQAAFNVELIASYPVALFGMRLLLRRLGLEAVPSLVGALIYAFSGFNLMHLNHMNAIAIVAHIPWLLLAVEEVMASGTARGRALGGAGIALLIGSQVLLGYPQYVWMSGLIAAVYTTVRAAALRTTRGLVPVATLALLGLAIGAVQVLPTAEASADSIRGVPSMSFLLSISMHPLNLVQIWSPYAFPERVYAGGDELWVHELSIYNGAFSAVAPFWLLARWRSLRHRPLVIVAACLCLTGVILALGRYGLLYQLLVQIPYLPWFRASARHILVVHFGLAILSAVAIDDLMACARRRDRLASPAVALLAAPIVLSLLAGLVAAPFLEDTPAARLQPLWFRLTAGAGLVAAATRIVSLSARGARPALLILPLFVAVDLGLWGYGYMWATPPRTIAGLAASIDLPESAPAGTRIAAQSLFGDCDIALLRGFSILPGYAGLPPARVLSPSDQSTLRLSGVSRVRGADGWTTVEPMARARLVADVRVSSDIAQDVKTITLADSALVSDELPPMEGPPGSAAIVEDRPGYMVIALDAPRRNLLVTTEAYHSGWRAADGERALRVVRAYGDYLAVLVEPGTRQVVLTFEPRSMRLGALVSLAGILLTVALTLWMRSGRDQPGTR